MSSGKIINDPVYGFLRFPEKEIMQVINHPWFQRLRRIGQMGLSGLVYPGAEHTRFHHSLGACHLMGRALYELSTKGFSISSEERLAARLAILMHDIGHGPFSHSLEYELVSGVSHEQIGGVLMQQLIAELHLPSLTSEIFNGTAQRPFLHQLVSSQLDVDRMDYLNRDSFYSGVSEGVIGYDRILQMLSLKDDQLVIEEKAIHSVEKFLIARRLMYWQVYLHKTVLGAEQLLIKIIQRARYLVQHGETLWAPDAFLHFLKGNYENSFFTDPQHLTLFCALDDADIMASIKQWQHQNDFVLSKLASMLMDRQLFKVVLGNDLSKPLEEQQANIQKKLSISAEDVSWFAFTGTTTNKTYDEGKGSIMIEMKDGRLLDIAQVDNPLMNSEMVKLVSKEYLCYLSV